MANTERGQCAWCQRALPAQSGQGRRRQYCGPTCRSAARRKRAPEPLVMCGVRVGDWYACGQLAVGELRAAGASTLAEVCAEHRAMAEAMLRARFVGLRWQRYAVAGRREDQDHAGSGREDQDHAGSGREDQDHADTARYTDADGWELSEGQALIAGHDGIDPDDVETARAWAAAELAAAYDVRVSGWRGDPDRGGHVALL